MGDRLATIDTGRKEEGAVPVFRELNPHLTQCRLGRGLPPYQVSSSHPMLGEAILKEIRQVLV